MLLALRLGLTLPAILGRRGGVRLSLFDDSVNGDDSNDGLTSSTALQTLAAAQALIQPNTNLILLDDSYWREQFDIPQPGFRSESEGDGAIPVIDGADVVTSGWTQPDAVTYPNVWSRSWTRASATTTSSEYLGYWEEGERTTRQTSLANLQAGADGDWHTTSLTAQTSTVSIRAAGDPNSDGILREITKRAHGINGHSTTLGHAAPARQEINGPLEIKRCVGHYNAIAGGPGVIRNVLLRDGNIHHLVTEGHLTENVIATEYHPEIGPEGAMVAYRADGTGFDHTFRGCMVLLPGGNSKIQNSNVTAFHGHSSSNPAIMRDISFEACISRGAAFGGPAAESVAITGAHVEDSYGPAFVISSPSSLQAVQVRDTVTPSPARPNYAGVRRVQASNTKPIALTNSSIQLLANFGMWVAGNADVVVSKAALIGTIPFSGFADDRASPNLTYSIFQGGRSLDNIETGYVGDFNVFYFVGQAAPQFGFNGTTYGGSNMSTWQAATGQDLNSVFLKAADQVSGNGIAFWKGIADGVNNGPVDGDFRINPAARVYHGTTGAQLSGVFADGVTPITEAGAQEHWNWNERAIVPGPPTLYPSLPQTIDEMRLYIRNPSTGWDFYPG